MPSGQTDVNLTNFSISKDLTYTIPVLKEAFAVNPNIKVEMLPWSRPAWMKQSGTMNGGNFNDSPRSPVNYSLGGTPINYNEVEQSFSATTYLLWDPALPLGCTPATTTGNGSSTTTKQSTCSGSIPIPLGNISWSWSGDGIDTEILQSSGTTQGTTFVLPCSPESEGSLGLTGGALPTMAEHCAVWHNI